MLQALTPVNTVDVNSFVDKERQQAERLRQLRHDERDRTNMLLKEKLRRQKEVERYLVLQSQYIYWFLI